MPILNRRYLRRGQLRRRLGVVKLRRAVRLYLRQCDDVQLFSLVRPFYQGRVLHKLRQITQPPNALKLALILDGGKMELGHRRQPLLEGANMDLRHDLSVVRQNGRGLDASRNALLPLGSRSVLLDTFTQTPAYAGLRAYDLSEPSPERTAGQSGVIPRRWCLLNAIHGLLFQCRILRRGAEERQQ